MCGDFPGGPVVETVLPMQGAEVQSLVRELTSHMPWYAAKKVLKKKKKKSSFKKKKKESCVDLIACYLT